MPSCRPTVKNLERTKILQQSIHHQACHVDTLSKFMGFFLRFKVCSHHPLTGLDPTAGDRWLFVCGLRLYTVPLEYTVVARIA